MAPSKAPTSWDEEDSESTPPSSPPQIARRGKFDDEEDDSDVLESWDAADDSDAEREKAKKAAEAKAKADAAAKASHKSVKQRIEERREETMRKRQEEDDESSEEEEDEADRLEKARQSEKASDMKHAEELFGGAGTGPASRGAAKAVTVQDDADPTNSIDLSSMKLFNPTTASQFLKLRETLVPLLNENGKKPQYALFMQEFTKQIVKDLNSDQVKKISSGLTALSNEKMKEEKAADKSGKKSKAAKTKASLAATRDVSTRADTTSYDDGLEE